MGGPIWLYILVKSAVAGHTDSLVLFIFYVCSMASAGAGIRHELIKLCLILWSPLF